MNAQSNTLSREDARALMKLNPAAPAIVVTGRETASIRAGTEFAGKLFAADTPISMPEGGLLAGRDYYVALDDEGCVNAEIASGLPSLADFAGFHFAPGGNATAREGGDDIPAINPCSIWDLNFRPACADPRGMALIDGKLWVDIYLLGVDHLKGGTSKFGVTIADGVDLPVNPVTGKAFKRFDYDAALAVMKHHGKGLLGAEEFFAAAHGVTERSSADDNPQTTKLDAPRTSKWGLMQATGNMWVWGHDGDPDQPRAWFFGGSWLGGESAGSRCAALGVWPDYSDGTLGARGRSDHLQLV